MIVFDNSIIRLKSFFIYRNVSHQLYNNKMAMNSKDIKCEVLYNKEILDTQHNYTEDDFAESVYVYINAIKDLMAKYVEKEIE